MWSRCARWCSEPPRGWAASKRMRKARRCPLCQRRVVQEVPDTYQLDVLICCRCLRAPRTVRFCRTLRIFGMVREGSSGEEIPIFLATGSPENAPPNYLFSLPESLRKRVPRRGKDGRFC